MQIGQQARPGTVKTQHAAETLRLYAGDWALFLGYCAAGGATALPASADLVARFLAADGCGGAALSRRLAAIDHQHRQRGLALPGSDPSVRAALRQARRCASRKTRAPAPSRDVLGRLAEGCRNDLAGQRDRALLLLLAAGFGRRAIVALQAEQLRFTEAGLDLQPGLHLPRAAGACAVRTVEEWLRHSGTRYGPVFRKINRWGQLEHAPLGTDAIRLILARHIATQPGRAS